MLQPDPLARISFHEFFRSKAVLAPAGFRLDPVGATMKMKIDASGRGIGARRGAVARDTPDTAGTAGTAGGGDGGASIKEKRTGRDNVTDGEGDTTIDAQTDAGARSGSSAGDVDWDSDSLGALLEDLRTAQSESVSVVPAFRRAGAGAGTETGTRTRTGTGESISLQTEEKALEHRLQTDDTSGKSGSGFSSGVLYTLDPSAHLSRLPPYLAVHELWAPCPGVERGEGRSDTGAETKISAASSQEQLASDRDSYAARFPGQRGGRWVALSGKGKGKGTRTGMAGATMQGQGTRDIIDPEIDNDTEVRSRRLERCISVLTFLANGAMARQETTRSWIAARL